MLRSLLEDRFKLVTHRETREVSAYVLTVAPGGPRFKASETNGPLGAFVKGGSMNFRQTSMSYLAGSVLTNLPSLGRPVVDATGLTDIYDFALRLDAADPAQNGGNPGDQKRGTLQQLDSSLPDSLKDLGLKLAPMKTPVEYLVVDHVEKPDAN